MNVRRSTVARGTGRDVLLDATLQLIGERGLHAITLREVASAAGLSLGSTTYHFADRDALLIAALSRLADSVSDYCANAMPESEIAELGPRELMNRVFTDFGTFYCNTARMLAQLELYTEAGRNPQVAEISARVLESYRNLLIRAYAAAGLDAEQATERVERILVYADGLALQSAAHGTPCELRDDAAAVIWMLATANV